MNNESQSVSIMLLEIPEGSVFNNLIDWRRLYFISFERIKLALPTRPHNRNNEYDHQCRTGKIFHSIVQLDTS